MSTPKPREWTLKTDDEYQYLDGVRETKAIMSGKNPYREATE
jgi:hypothetical protein